MTELADILGISPSSKHLGDGDLMAQVLPDVG